MTDMRTILYQCAYGDAWHVFTSDCVVTFSGGFPLFDEEHAFKDICSPDCGGFYARQYEVWLNEYYHGGPNDRIRAD